MAMNKDERFGLIYVIITTVLSGLWIMNCYEEPQKTAASARKCICGKCTCGRTTGGGNPVRNPHDVYREYGMKPGPGGGYVMPRYHLFPDGTLRVPLDDGTWSEGM